MERVLRNKYCGASVVMWLLGWAFAQSKRTVAAGKERCGARVSSGEAQNKVHGSCHGAPRL